MTDMLTSVSELERPDRQDALAVPARSSVSPIDLRSTIATRVIPRLQAAMQKDLQRPRHHLISAERCLRNEVATLSGHLLADEQEAARNQVDSLRVGGRSLESLYLNLFAPTACHLRDLWSDDFCGFADVTLALCNLHGLLRIHAAEFQAEGGVRDTGLRALIVSPSSDGLDAGMPTFGLLLMAQFFRRDGWDAWIERDLASSLFRKSVGEWFDLVEVLAPSEKKLDEIASGIRAIRRGSPNPAIGVIVCGQVFVDHPEFVRLVGADRMAADPLSSLAQAKACLDDKISRPGQVLATRPTHRHRLS